MTLFILLFMSSFVKSELNDTNVNSKFIRDFCSKIGVTKSISCCWVGKALVFTGYTALAFIVGFIVVPLLCCICGFRPIGVREDSLAARYQSIHGTPKPFSCLQSLSMKGNLAWIIAITGTLLAAIKIFYYEKKCG
jgi:hypothetical protein